ncbi:glutaredoxin-like protein C5orf63 homolog isoform X2 [Oxyura jamaicensis]|uniref:glutaredoxin-like protein C5orf63 homolog isoform X2 n=1 Tax=Oxyura jamaicensis TaxID=8884 RepID=UPI0015A56F1B|nr:glutaredoxin-like protein C5orf63 homolog isoform X2 [Oxyura jamaicensis]
MGAARGGSPGAASRRRPSRAGPRRLPPGRGLASVAGRARSGAGLAAPRSPAARTMVLFFLSRTTHLARYSSSLLGRQLCSASANMPVLTLFTKINSVCKEDFKPKAEKLILSSCEWYFMAEGWSHHIHRCILYCVSYRPNAATTNAEATRLHVLQICIALTIMMHDQQETAV